MSKDIFNNEEERLSNILKGNIDNGVKVTIRMSNMALHRNDKINASKTIILKPTCKPDETTFFVITFSDVTAYIKYSPVLFETFEDNDGNYVVPIENLSIL
jgi:hypothetical protein